MSERSPIFTTFPLVFSLPLLDLFTAFPCESTAFQRLRWRAVLNRQCGTPSTVTSAGRTARPAPRASALTCSSRGGRLGTAAAATL